MDVEERQDKFERENAAFAQRDKMCEIEENLALWGQSWMSDTGLEFLVEGVSSSELGDIVEAGPSRTDDSPGVAPGSTQNS